MFKSEGDRKVIQQLVSLFNQGISLAFLGRPLTMGNFDLGLTFLCLSLMTDLNASLPDGLNPVDVAALSKYYLASLPEPLTTFELYNEIVGARSSINLLRNILKKLPAVNYMTLEFITALLLRVSQKSLLNKVKASPPHPLSPLSLLSR